jgi:hypothetical protein
LCCGLPGVRVAADVTELLPLQLYQSSVAIDANEDGQVVGFSTDPVVPTPTTMRATLWKDGKAPISLSGATSNSVAFRINGKGDVLIAEGVPTDYGRHLHGGFHWEPASAYRLWREGQPLVDLADAGAAAVDLNDLDQVLLRKTDGTAAIRNLNTGKTKDLPQPPPDISPYTYRQYLGIDHAGRVACWVFHAGPGPAIAGLLSQAWRLEPDGTDWIKVDPIGPGQVWWDDFSNLSYCPRLTRSGLLMANKTHYWDLNLKATTRKAIPATPKRVGVYRNSSPNGQRIVGFEADSDYAHDERFLWKNAVATYYAPGAPTATSLSAHLPGIESSIAVAATDAGLIVGNGLIGQRVRAWTLIFLKRAQPLILTTEIDAREIQPMALIAHQLFLTLTLPDPPPWETFRARAHQHLQAMTTAERKDAFVRLTSLADNVRSLEDEIRQASKPSD